MTEHQGIKFVAVGLDKEILSHIKSTFSSVDLLEIADAGSFEKLVSGSSEGSVHLSFCGPSVTEVALADLTSKLKKAFPNTPVFYVGSDKTEHDLGLLKKEGFDEGFLFPAEEKVFGERVQEILTKGLGREVYRAIKLHDLMPEEKTGFDVFLFMPMNKKYIKYIRADGAITQEQRDRLIKHHVGACYIRTVDLPKFYDYTANRLKSLSDGDGISETERRERLQGSVRSIFTHIFTPSEEESETPEDVLKDVQGIVDSFIKGSEGSEFYEKIRAQIGETESSYSHSTNVSVYASLFAMALEIGKPEDVGAAGMLHDLGEAEIPSQIVDKPEEEMTSDEKVLYEDHPAASIKIIKERKLDAPEAVLTAIIQHHERFNGSGFPEGLAGRRISPEAQILGLADEFDLLTRKIAGRKNFTPPEAVQNMIERQSFDVEVLKKVLALFPQ